MQTARFKRTATHPTTITLVVLTALWVFFFWRLLTPTQGDRVIFAKGDFPLHYYSYANYQAERMGDGEIPLWNPYNYGGDPFAANVQWNVWYPPRWIAILVAGDWTIEVMQLEVAAHYWIASLMMCAFLRALVKKMFPALVGAIVWTYGGYLSGYPMLQPSVLYAIVWLPLMMLGAQLSLTDDRWRVRGILLGAAAMGVSFFGGHTQTTMQMTYFTAAYIAFVVWQQKRRWTEIVWRVGLLGAAGAALSAVQLLPAVELTRLSYRAETYFYEQKSVGFTVSELVQFVWPRLFQAEYWPLYLGVAGLLLAVGAMLRPRAAHWFWMGTVALMMALALGGHSIVYDLFYVVVPGFNTFREQERAASLAIFALVVLATYQIDWLMTRRGENKEYGENDEVDARRFRWVVLGHLILTGIAFGVIVLAYLISDKKGLPGMIPDTFGFVFWISVLFSLWLVWFRRGPQVLLPAALVALIVFDLFTFGMKSPNFVTDNAVNRIQKPDHYQLLHADVEDIQWHVDGAAGIQTYGTYWRIPDIYGTGPFSLASIERLRQIRVDRRWEVLAVRYATMIADVPENVPVEVVGEGVNYDGQEYTVYELTDPRPFAQLVYQIREAKNDKDARVIMSEPWINLREIGVITDDLPFELSGERPDDAAVRAFKMVSAEYMEMEVSTSEPALLTVAVANYPGWRATVNGKKVDIVDTSAGLIGIPVPAGTGQKVTLQFVPMSVIVGGVVSVIALVGMVGYVVGVAIMQRRRIAG